MDQCVSSRLVGDMRVQGGVCVVSRKQTKRYTISSTIRCHIQLIYYILQQAQAKVHIMPMTRSKQIFTTMLHSNMETKNQMLIFTNISSTTIFHKVIYHNKLNKLTFLMLHTQGAQRFLQTKGSGFSVSEQRTWQWSQVWLKQSVAGQGVIDELTWANWR